MLSLGIGSPCLGPALLANTESNTLLEVLLDVEGNNNFSCLAEISFPLFPFFLNFPSFSPSSSSHRPSSRSSFLSRGGKQLGKGCILKPAIESVVTHTPLGPRRKHIPEKTSSGSMEAGARVTLERPAVSSGNLLVLVGCAQFS